MRDFKKQGYSTYLLFALVTTVLVIGICLIIIRIVDDAGARSWSYRFAGVFMMLSPGGIFYPMWFTKSFLALSNRKIRILLLRSFDAQLDRMIYAAVAPLTVHGRAAGLRSPKNSNPSVLYDPADIGSVECMDDEWQAYAQHLMYEAEIIVLFLTSKTPGVEWELKRLSTPELARKTVLVTNRRDEWNDLPFEHWILVGDSWANAQVKLEQYIRNLWFSDQSVEPYSFDSAVSQVMGTNRGSSPWPADMSSNMLGVPSRLYNIFGFGATYAGFLVGVLAVAITAVLISAAELRPHSSGSHHNAGLMVGLLPAVGWTVFWLSLWGTCAPRDFLARSDVWSLYAALGFKDIWNTRGCSTLVLVITISGVAYLISRA